MFGALISFASAAFSAVCSVGSKALTLAANVFKPCISLGREVLIGAVETVGRVLQMTGIFRPDDSLEDMGDRALQAAEAGIRPESHDRYEEYLKNIREFSLDPEKSKSLDPVAKQIAGLGVGAYCVDRKFDLAEGQGARLFMLGALNPKYFSDERIVSFMQSAQGLARVIDFYSGVLDPAQAGQVGQGLVSEELGRRPGVERGSIVEEIKSAFDSVAALRNQEVPRG